VLAALTLAFAGGHGGTGMALFTLLARAGWSVLRLERWARYEGVGPRPRPDRFIGLLVVFHQH
jgi:hypothetical protein